MSLADDLVAGKYADESREVRDELRALVNDRSLSESERARRAAVTTQVVSSAKQPSELPPPSEPMAVARAMVAAKHAHASGEMLLRRWRGGWWKWETTRWAERDEKHVDAAAYAFTEHAVYLDAKGKPHPWAPNRYKVADLLAALGAVTYLRESLHAPDWSRATHMPTARELVSVENGLLHITTRELHDHDPRLFNLVSVPFPYAPGTSAPARWLRFLDELWPDDPEAIAALQEYFGYIVSGDTSQHKILLLVGPRRGGKGTIARVLKELLGRGNYCGPTLASLGTNFGLEPLVGKPLAIVSDARLGGANVHQVVERLLSISGEDMLTIDRKYRQHWTGTLPTRFVIISNELPRFGDASGAIASRFILLTLTKSWLGKENTRLTNELLEELPGILNWALDGLERLQSRARFTTVASSVDALGALADLVSPVAAFVREHCDRGPYEVPVETLYQKWKSWAEDNGHRAGSAQSFGRDLRAVVPGLKVVQHRESDTDRARHYQGVRLSEHFNGADRVPPRASTAEEDPARNGTRENPLKSRLEEPSGNGRRHPQLEKLADELDAHIEDLDLVLERVPPPSARAYLGDDGRPHCSACDGELQELDQYQCPRVKCQATLRATR